MFPPIHARTVRIRSALIRRRRIKRKKKLNQKKNFPGAISVSGQSGGEEAWNHSIHESLAGTGFLFLGPKAGDRGIVPHQILCWFWNLHFVLLFTISLMSFYDWELSCGIRVTSEHLKGVCFLLFDIYYSLSTIDFVQFQLDVLLYKACTSGYEEMNNLS